MSQMIADIKRAMFSVREKARRVDHMLADARSRLLTCEVDLLSAMEQLDALAASLPSGADSRLLGAIREVVAEAIDATAYVAAGLDGVNDPAGDPPSAGDTSR